MLHSLATYIGYIYWNMLHSLATYIGYIYWNMLHILEYATYIVSPARALKSPSRASSYATFISYKHWLHILSARLGLFKALAGPRHMLHSLVTNIGYIHWNMLYSLTTNIVYIYWQPSPHQMLHILATYIVICYIYCQPG
uniref:Uncharacterized protein n=1 Tax=Capsaspora owczarzaki TaxID=192875 RepID=M1K4S0_9EUKA|nr:hypothetical protein [Capsaspora owczarzaki]